MNIQQILHTNPKSRRNSIYRCILLQVILRMRVLDTDLFPHLFVFKTLEVGVILQPRDNQEDAHLRDFINSDMSNYN